MRYTFEWDAIKATENQRKHGISFELAAEVFLDQLAVSIYDEDYSEMEERWGNRGRDMSGRVLVFMHTFSEVSVNECKVRVISARKATRRETRQYAGIER